MPKDMLAEPATAPMATATPPKPALPTFKARWWYKPNRLDARPLIWSLYNRPQDWEIVDRQYFRHNPSQHYFYRILEGPTPLSGYKLADHTACSCRTVAKGYQRFQRRLVGRAYRHWLRTYWNPSHVHPAHQKVQDQFTKHFVY